jgi:AcrR family transcriptional regulator
VRGRSGVLTPTCLKYTLYTMPRASTADRMLSAARALFAAGGMEAITVRGVAAKVGVTPMAVYRHFAGKDALVDALVLEGLDRWAARLAAVDVDDPLDWLIAAGDEFLAFALEEPRRFEAAFLVPSSGARRFPDDFANGRSPAGRLWIPRLDALRQAGRLAPDVEPLDVGFTLWALAQGLVTLHRAGRFTGGVDDFRAFYRRAVRRCLASFVTTRAP